MAADSPARLSSSWTACSAQAVTSTSYIHARRRTHGLHPPVLPERLSEIACHLQLSSSPAQSRNRWTYPAEASIQWQLFVRITYHGCVSGRCTAAALGCRQTSKTKLKQTISGMWIRCFPLQYNSCYLIQVRPELQGYNPIAAAGHRPSTRLEIQL